MRRSREGLPERETFSSPVPKWGKSLENSVLALDFVDRLADNKRNVGALMFTGINLRPADSPTKSEENAVDMLLSCHERIRRFTALARKIAECKEASPEQICDAAADVHRYFTIALPLHEADETISIEPRLQASAPDSEAGHAAREMIRQHGAINAVLRQLLPLWDALCREPEKSPDFSPRLLALTSDFETLWASHLKLEEEFVFPAVDRLSPSEKTEILREMRERRRIQENAA